MKKKKRKNSQTLNRLIKVWDERLKKSGFVDIENRKTGLLKKTGGDVYWSPELYESPSTNNDLGYSSLTWKESQAEYYRVASQCLHEYEFKSIRERIIWQLHAEGISDYEIVKEINSTYRKVRYVIEQLQKEFGLKICRK